MFFGVGYVGTSRVEALCNILFDSFSGDTLDYDINNDKVVVKGSEDGTERVKFKIVL